MASLADIRKRLADQENKRNSAGNSEGEGPVYPHWNIKDGDTAIVRFLEDGNPENPYFWVERAMFKFPFNGIKGDPSAGKVIVQVPCMEMYGERDPVLDEVRTWFKDSKLEDMGRTYWKKRSYLFQGFVRQDPMNPEGNGAPENPIRRFIISPQIFNLIKNSLMDPEIENLPTDKDSGLDFRIIKTTKGGYGDYTNSSWARKESALTDEEVAAIGSHGLSNLADFLPPKPTEEVLKVIREMFEASVDGEPYDPARWGAYFTPPGMAKQGGNDNKDADAAPTEAAENQVAHTEVAPAEAQSAERDTSTRANPVVEETPAADVVKEEKVEDAPEANSDKANDILAMIRSRQQK